MFNINSQSAYVCKGSIALGTGCRNCSRCLRELAEGDRPLFKATPAQDLLSPPGWRCTRCDNMNAVTAPFCPTCEGDVLGSLG